MTTTPSSSSCCAPSCCDGKSSRLPADASPDAIRAEVRSRYSQVANRGGSDRPRDLSIGIGYSAAELDGVPAEANLGVGCGNPTALAERHPGETVLDIGSGGGIRQFTEGTVDFGASDGPMNESQIQAVSGNVVHIPTVLGSVVVTYNLPSVSYTHLRAHETVLDLVCRLLLEKKKHQQQQ